MDARLKSEEIAHSKLGASSSERWMNCSGSVQMIAKTPPDVIRKAGSAAALGTAAHTVGSVCLEAGQDAWELSGETVEAKDWKFIVDTEMVEATQVYIDYVRQRFEQFKDKGAKLFIETAMSTTLDPDAFGTGDTVIYVPADRIIIVDYKNGMKVVEPTSSQLKEYAYLAVEKFLDNDDLCKIVELVIVQPRMPHPDGLVRKHVMSVQEVVDWFRNECLPAMARTREPDALLQVGDWCGFCPAREVCPAVRHEITSFTAMSDPIAMTNPELGSLLTKLKAISKLEEPYEMEALKRARMGQKVPGWKLVKKKANRVYRDAIVEQNVKEGGKPVTLKLDEAIEITFGAEAYTKPKMKTPPQIAELPGGKAFVARWAYTPDAGETLAPEGDKREASVPLLSREIPGEVSPAI